jgi:hypothetical protein
MHHIHRKGFGIFYCKEKVPAKRKKYAQAPALLQVLF